RVSCAASVFIAPPTSELYTLSLHDALPILAEHVGQRHQGLHRLRVAAGVGALDLAATAVDVADHVAQVILRRHHLDRHDRFEQLDRKSTRLNSSHVKISYAVFCLKKKTNTQ